MRATARFFVAAGAIVAWIIISNHCALRALATTSPTAEKGCPFHSKPAGSIPKSPVTECCKILRAISTTASENIAPAIVDLANKDPESVGGSRLAAKISGIREELDTGPPGTTAFDQLVQSMRAHGPPC